MRYKLSGKAEHDLRKIYQYSQLNFGELQATSYLTALEESIQQIADTPAIAQKVGDIRPKYKRYLYQKHATYFIEKKSFSLAS